MTTFGARGGIFGLSPVFSRLVATSLETEGLQVNGNANVTNTLSVNGEILLNGQSLGGLMLQGVWDASTNTPDLTSTTPENNQFWIVSVAGNTTLGSISTWSVNDWALYINDAWTKISGGDRGVYATVDIGQMTLSETSVVVNTAATDLNLTPGTTGSVVVPTAVKTPQINGSGGTGTGTLSLYSGNSETIKLTDSNQVGVNVSAPLSALHVKGEVDGSPADTGVHIGMSGNYGAIELSGSDGGYLDFQDGNGDTDFTGRILYSNSSDSMEFYTNGNNSRLTIDSSGHIGIGVTSPLSPLHVRGDIDASPNTGGVHIGESSNNTYAAIEMSGTAGGYIDFQDATETSDHSGRIIYRHTDDEMEFHTGTSSGTETRMTLGDSAEITTDLGVGTSSPSGRIHATKTANNDADVDVVIEAGTPVDNLGSNNAKLTLTSKGKNILGTTITHTSEIEALGRGNAGSILMFKTQGTGASDVPVERARFNTAGGFIVGGNTQFDNAHLSVGLEGMGIGRGQVLGQYRRNYMDTSMNLIWTNGSNSPQLTSAGAWSDASDVAYKRDIKDLDYGMDIIKKLIPRSYHMKDNSEDNDPQIGLVAQEVQKVLPECVSGTEGNLGISYGRLTAVLINAIKEMSEKIEKLEKQQEA